MSIKKSEEVNDIKVYGIKAYLQDYLCARLLKVSEWKKIMAEVPNVPIDVSETWWLSDDLDFDVNDEGAWENEMKKPCLYPIADGYGQILNESDMAAGHGVRPLFSIDEDISYGLVPGDKILIKDVLCTFVFMDSYFGNALVLSDVILTKRPLCGLYHMINSNEMRDIIAQTKSPLS